MNVLNLLSTLMESAHAPRIPQPTAKQQAALDGYWMAVISHLDVVMELQKMVPGWLPEFREVGSELLNY